MHNQILIRLFLAAAAISVVASGSLANAQAREDSSAADWIDSYEPHADEEMPYRLMPPIAFDDSELYPVIVSLHGGGGRGTDNRRQLRGWNRLLADEATRKQYPSYVLAPQSTHLWGAAHLKKIKAIVAELPAADLDRVYVLGHSMGGHGSFIVLQIDPSYFAAAAPSAGTGRGQDEEFIDASLIKDVPIWAFHGDGDTVAPYERAETLFATMTDLGGNFKLTTWVGDAHSVATKMIAGGDNGSTKCASDRCDAEPEMLQWLFSHTLSGRP
ncbi:MAG: dienelactone hydrolase family protein [Bryobacterales bacterium]|nr:dienelactone hydrolase family protein [Bryobacterales bacterium]MDE0263884.1 dienelactone hydrolase family protein [Bryobacterales bacterium]